MPDYKVTIFIAAILLSIGLLAGRLFGLQIIGRGDAQEVSRGNALRTLRLLPARGAIYDRHGVLMVHNEPSYAITLTPRYFVEDKTALLARHLGVEDSVVEAKLAEAREWTPYRPSISFTDVPFERYSRIQEDLFRLPGVDDEISQKRRYLSDARASHALGYISEITREELDIQEQPRFYTQGDLLGRTGVERSYETYLRGIPGSALRVVNVHGLEVKPYLDGKGDVAPVSGYDIHLAMDAGVQALAESLFVNKRGAAVALDVATGGVLVLHSAPDFDLGLFTGGINQPEWRAIVDHSDKLLYNRVSMNQMPPGSTWKPLMALMSLDAGLIAPTGPNSTVFCGGYHPLGGGHIFRCLGVHGSQDVVQALENSCNTFFFEMARRMDLGTFRRYANSFGFGQRAPSDIREQTTGLIPDSAYFNDRYATWGMGTLMNLGVGQGDMGVTPLQLVRYIAAVANGGWLHEPRLVSFLANPATGDTIHFAPEPVHIPVDTAYFSLVRQGLKRVMETGTGRAMQIPGIASGGKTGTAQAPMGMTDHSVFVMFAPYEEPRIAVAVQCENTGSSGMCAAPIASLLAERYLKGAVPESPSKSLRLGRAMMASSQALLTE